jgi:hypothetical protein
MKTFVIVIGTMALAVILVVAGFFAGSIWNQSRWGNNVMGNRMMGPIPMGPIRMGPGLTGSSVQDMPCIEGQPGYGMMGDNWNDIPFGSAQDMPCSQGYVNPDSGDVSSLEDVEAAAHEYVERLGYSGLDVTEVMEFQRNYYAIIAEEDTGIGAMELLVDKDSGAIGPEPGPNMMWNAKYGMMGPIGMRPGMMGMTGGYATGEMTLSPQEAEAVAQRWLDINLPGRTAGEADEFYGYYTLHFLDDGQIEGMLSVHGSSGDVWYHSWHGDFVAMTGGHS